MSRLASCNGSQRIITSVFARAWLKNCKKKYKMSSCILLGWNSESVCGSPPISQGEEDQTAAENWYKGCHGGRRGQ